MQVVTKNPTKIKNPKYAIFSKKKSAKVKSFRLFLKIEILKFFQLALSL